MSATIRSMPDIIEAKYPRLFRQAQTAELGTHIRHHNSVVLIGMKRVGISNFLRFFLHHPEVRKTYIQNGMTHYFIPVDLNDLVERGISPFWMLVLTRLVDATQKNDLAENLKAECRRLFRESIQLKDLFFTVDKIHKIISLLAANGVYPTFFFIRFDRLRDALRPEVFDNLQGLKDAAKQKLSYVFTSYRPLNEIAPLVFPKAALSVFSNNMYLTPAQKQDMMSILETFETRYALKLPETLRTNLVALAAGHVQYLQLALIHLREKQKLPKDPKELLTMLSQDEDITRQSEELFDSLTKEEQHILLEILENKTVDNQSKKKAQYLWDTGIVTHTNAIFSPLLAEYLSKISLTKQTGNDFTKKEHLLFSYLKTHEGELCERDDIIRAVWPEQQEIGVTDWAIDRLVARVRAKLRTQKSNYQIVTVVTRGYKLALRH